MSAILTTSVHRMCLKCDEVFEKRTGYTHDEWKCNSCFKKDPTKTIFPKPFFPLGSIGTLNVADADSATWKKLFDYIDADASGHIDMKEMRESMASMIGNFDWQDISGDGVMDFEEFLLCTNHFPASTRAAAFSYAKLLNPGTRRVVQAQNSSPTLTKRTSLAHIMSPEDDSAWRALFNYIDEDASGTISMYEMESTMSKMLGEFHWENFNQEDEDEDASMDFAEFLHCVTNKLTATKRLSALAWSKAMLIEKQITNKSASKRRESLGASDVPTTVSTGSLPYVDGSASATITAAVVPNTASPGSPQTPVNERKVRGSTTTTAGNKTNISPSAAKHNNTVVGRNTSSTTTTQQHRPAATTTSAAHKTRQ